MALVSRIMGVIDESVMNAGERFFNTTAGGMAPVMTIATSILLILVGMNMAIGFYRMNIKDSMQLIFRICLIYVFAFSWSNFSQFYDAFSNASATLAMEFFNLAASSGHSNPYAAMDEFSVQMADAADGVARAQGSIMRGVMGALSYVALSALMAIYVLIVGFAKIMLAFLLGVAPLAIVATIFERTKNLFEAWLSSFVGYLMYPIAASSVISVIVAVANEQFVAQDNVDNIGQILGFMTVVTVGIFALKAIPAAASNITGHFQLANITPDALRLAQVGTANAPGVKQTREAVSKLRTMREGFKHGADYNPKNAARDRDRALRERGAAMRQIIADRRLLRGDT